MRAKRWRRTEKKRGASQRYLAFYHFVCDNATKKSFCFASNILCEEHIYVIQSSQLLSLHLVCLEICCCFSNSSSLEISLLLTVTHKFDDFARRTELLTKFMSQKRMKKITEHTHTHTRNRWALDAQPKAWDNAYTAQYGPLAHSFSVYSFLSASLFFSQFATVVIPNKNHFFE